MLALGFMAPGLCAAAYSLGRAGASNAAPILLTNLQQLLQGPQPSATDLQEQSEAVQDYHLDAPGQPSNPLDSDNLLPRVQAVGLQRVAARAGDRPTLDPGDGPARSRGRSALPTRR